MSLPQYFARTQSCALRTLIPLLLVAVAFAPSTTLAADKKIPLSQCMPRPCSCEDMPLLEHFMNTTQKNLDAWEDVRAASPRCPQVALSSYADKSSGDKPLTNALLKCEDYKPPPADGKCSTDADCGTYGACSIDAGGAAPPAECPGDATQSSAEEPDPGDTPSEGTCRQFFHLGQWGYDQGEPMMDPCFCKTMCDDIVNSTGAHEEQHHWDYTWGFAVSAVLVLTGDVKLKKPVRYSLDSGTADRLAASEINSHRAQVEYLQEAIDDFMNSPAGEDCTWEPITPRATLPVNAVPKTFTGRLEALFDRVWNGKTDE